MRLGVCGSAEQADLFKRLGFEYVEVNVQRALRGDVDDAAWAAEAPDPARTALPMEAANGLVPNSLPIVGPKRDLAALQTYMQRVAARAARLGISRLVFGSGNARKRPDDVDESTALDHIAEFCHIAGDACAAHDVLIVIEHLNRGETNTINSVAEEIKLMEAVDHPAVTALVDTYHLGVEGESDQVVLELGERLNHVHVAEPVGRVQPGAPGNSEHFDFESFFCTLRKIGYDQRISFEGKWSSPIEEAAPAMLTHLREAWDRAGRCES